MQVRDHDHWAMAGGSIQIEEWGSSMQQKLSVGDAGAANGKSYGVSVSCNKCGGTHDMGVSVTMADGPVVKQSIASLYDGKGLPKTLSDLSGNSMTCPRTGRQTIQKNSDHIFLVPPKS